MQKEFESLEFPQGVNFDYTDLLNNIGTRCLVNFDDSCDEIGKSNAFVNFATAGRHHGLSTIYIKHNLFNQSKLWQDAGLQNKQIVHFKSFRDVMQVSKLSAQFGLKTELVDWYRDATSVHYGFHWLTCRSE